MNEGKVINEDDHEDASLVVWVVLPVMSFSFFFYKTHPAVYPGIFGSILKQKALKEGRYSLSEFRFVVMQKALGGSSRQNTTSVFVSH